MNYGAGRQRRFKRQTLSKEGDIVIVTASRNHYHALRLESGQIYNCKYGHFSHDDMIGQSFGSWIKSRVPPNNKSRQKQKQKQKEKQKQNDDNDASSNSNKVIGKKREHSSIKPKTNTTLKYGELCLLRPTCELWTLSLSHRTQILYDADKSLITYLLQITSNDIIFESGTGSGSLSTSFSRIISPFGHLFTFEFNQLRADYARLDFKNLLIDNLITVIHRNIVQNGFPQKKELIDIINHILNQYENTKTLKTEKEEKNENEDIDLENSNKERKKKKNISEYKDSFGSSKKIDKLSWLTDEKIKNLKDWISKLTQFDKEEFVNGVFLDLPKPFDAIKSAYHVLKCHGKICSFSPCIEQVQRTCQSLANNGFVDIRTFEVLSRDHLIREHEFPALDLNTNNSIHAIRSRPNSSNSTRNTTLNTINMMTSRPVGKSFGHTGYLTFALKALST